MDKRRNSYDDISSHDRNSENGRMHRMIRVLLSLLIIFLILGSAAFLVFSFRGDVSSNAAEEPDAELEQQEGEAARTVREALSQQQDDALQEDPPPDEEEQQATDVESEPEEDDTSQGVQYTVHVLQEDEQIEDVAGRYGLDPRTVVSVNQISASDVIAEGLELRIPDRDGKLYTIRAGDSLSRIAHAHGMGYITLAQVNGMDPNAVIHPGRSLFIPRITMSMQEYQRIMGTLVLRPVQGPVITPFGEKRNPITQEIEYPGIEFDVSVGTPVRAAVSGTVSGVLNEHEGLGRYVEMTHDDGYVTVYGHLDQVNVSQGQRVNQGDVIGSSGSTGMTLEPVLYFSMSRNGVPQDPSEFF